MDDANAATRRKDAVSLAQERHGLFAVQEVEEEDRRCLFIG